MVSVSEVYMNHSEGTKFYEVISFWSSVTSRGSVVRRWGSVGTKGDKKTEWFDTLASMQRAATSVIESKKKRGYSHGPSRSTLGTSISESSFSVALNKHYGDGKFAAGLCEAMRIGDSDVGSDVSWEEVVFESKPEPVRAGDWASW